MSKCCVTCGQIVRKRHLTAEAIAGIKASKLQLKLLARQYNVSIETIKKYRKAPSNPGFRVYRWNGEART